MLTIKQIDMVASQLGNYLETNNYRNDPVTLRYLEDTSVATDIELLSYLCDMLISRIKKEHNLVNLLGLRLKLIELKRGLQSELILESVGYAEELLSLFSLEIDKLSPSAKDRALNLLTKYRLSKSMVA